MHVRDGAEFPKDSSAEPKNRKAPPVVKRADCKGLMHAVMKPRIMAMNPEDLTTGRMTAFILERTKRIPWDRENEEGVDGTGGGGKGKECSSILFSTLVSTLIGVSAVCFSLTSCV
jgi:hypothetical protein